MDLNIFLPDDLSAINNSCTIGYVIKVSDNLWGIFVIKTHNEKNIKQEEIQSRFGDSNVTENNFLRCDVVLDHSKDIQIADVDNYLRVHIKNGKFSIKSLVISKNTLDFNNDIRKSVFLLYNRSEFLTTEILFPNLNCEQKLNKGISSNSNLNQFCVLKNLLSKETHTRNDHSKAKNIQNGIFGLYFLYNLIELITGYSRLFSHVSNISKFISQILFSIWKERKVNIRQFYNFISSSCKVIVFQVSVKVGNFITALLLDLTLGLIILYWINLQFPNLENDFFEIIEVRI